ncbi:MAG TPA: hypothetical protein VH969_17615 [Actinophytocola sp.]|jgi:hypothetical protein|uniref:hypothetical protein n=1 Tax=Actinophytocola sp. TaxID=1872138 RepID=UPI002F946954
MGDGEPAARRIRVSAEAVFDVTDPAAVERAAVERIQQAEISQFGGSPDELDADEREAVRGDLVKAISWITEPHEMVALSGVEPVEAEYSVDEIGHGGVEDGDPDFAALFPICRCGRETCERCGGFQLTPRTAACLWVTGQMSADQAYEDVVQRGDEPVGADSDWMLFDQYPRITWRQDAVWRRQAARAFDDLVEDIEAGEWPRPRCAGEEMALHLMLRYAEAAAGDDLFGLDGLLEHLPTHRDDLAWELATETLFQDTEIRWIFDPEHDGAEDPENDVNRDLGIGDYRPPAWFTAFDNMEPRDGRRPFRR